MYKRFIALISFFGIAFSFLYMRIYCITQSDMLSEVAANQGSYTVTINKTYANIYDCNMNPLVNRKDKYLAVINPTAQSTIDILPYVLDKEYFYNRLEQGKPFVCEVSKQEIFSDEIITFSVKERTSSDQIASHIVGYTVDNNGVTGIEKAYNEFLRSNFSTNKISYSVDANGALLNGADKKIDIQKDTTAGVITTLDYDIQKICEKACEDIDMGAVIVMDPYSSELKAVVSVPDFNPLDLESSLDDKRTPFVNRAFSAYNVGSIFKLVTAATAIEQGIDTNLEYNCTGSIDINGQIFRCHDHEGHGIMNMHDGMVESCNPYYINLSMLLNNTNFLNKASMLGFGRQTILAEGIVSASGNIQTEQDLKSPAEKANLAFGQGKLMATPLQISNLTSTIVNNGMFKQAKLIKGVTDGTNTTWLEDGIAYQAIEPATAYDLRLFMTDTVQNNEESTARPYNTTAAGKTSTAQTGKFKENGEEILQAWFTGYFPVDNPKYVVTVMIEDGKSGNITAAPVFKKIAEEITMLDKK